jgi:hypothetical protein
VLPCFFIPYSFLYIGPSIFLADTFRAPSSGQWSSWPSHSACPFCSTRMFTRGAGPFHKATSVQSYWMSTELHIMLFPSVVYCSNTHCCCYSLKIWRTHGYDCTHRRFLGHDTVYSCGFITTFRKNKLHPSSDSNNLTSFHFLSSQYLRWLRRMEGWLFLSWKESGRKRFRPYTGVRLLQRCTSRAHRTVCEDVCSSACTRANDATVRPGMWERQMICLLARA